MISGLKSSVAKVLILFIFCFQFNSFAVETDLHLYIERKDTVRTQEVLQRYRERIESGTAVPELEEQDSFGRTVLMLAAKKRNIEVVNLILNLGAHLEVRDHSENTALMHAARAGNFPIFMSILKKGADPHAVNHHKNNAFFWAAQKGHVQIMEALLKLNVDVDRVNSSSNTALIWAARAGESDAVELLLKHHAKIDHLNTEGRTALSFAASEGVLEVFVQLLLAGADPFIKDKQEKSPHTYLSAPGNTSLQTVFMFVEKIWNAKIDDELIALEAQLEESTWEDPEFVLKDDIHIKPLVKKAFEQQRRNLFDQKIETEIKGSVLCKVECALCGENYEVLQNQIFGPAGCGCFLCVSCGDSFSERATKRRRLNELESDLIQCPGPGCGRIVQSSYFENIGRSRKEVRDFRDSQIRIRSKQLAGWKFCRGVNNYERCTSGKMVLSDAEKYHNCSRCDWKGCLVCGDDHKGTCNEYREEVVKSKEIFDFWIAEGKKKPPTNGHPEDKNDPDYNAGRRRQCIHCGVLNEKVFSGQRVAGQCNSMVCTNSACKREIHFNYGSHDRHPSYEGTPTLFHDWDLMEIQYECEIEPFSTQEIE